MCLLVISEVKKIKDLRVVKRRKLDTKKFENIDWQKDLWWEVTHGCWPLVQGHMEGNTWTRGSYPFQPQTAAEVPTQHENSTWSTRRENGRGPWRRGGSVPECTRRYQVWRHRGGDVLPLRTLQLRASWQSHVTRQTQQKKQLSL